jgi:type I restriction enzyme M protein
MNHQALSSFIWSVADLLRGDYKQSDYGKVILPFTETAGLRSGGHEGQGAGRACSQAEGRT